MAEYAVVAAVVVSAAAAAASAYIAADAQAKTAEAQSDAISLDRKIKAQEAGMKEKQQRLIAERLREMYGSQAGKAGVVAHAGSPLLAELEATQLSEFDIQATKWGYQMEDVRMAYQRKILNWQAGNYNTMKYVNTGLSLLGSASTIATAWPKASPTTTGGE